ncbi:MAG TPA: hypothetical protein VJ201_05225 [Candidatus Babeliales bacterium]|nr:hypothetical protein [Candidatus Babeliales bacterium]
MKKIIGPVFLVLVFFQISSPKSKNICSEGTCTTTDGQKSCSCEKDGYKSCCPRSIGSGDYKIYGSDKGKCKYRSEVIKGKQSRYDYTDKSCPTGTCNSDSQCTKGNICMDKKCIVGCRKDSQCSKGNICMDNKCIVGCHEDSQCTKGLKCIDNKCVSACTQYCDSKYDQPLCEHNCANGGNQYSPALPVCKHDCMTRANMPLCTRNCSGGGKAPNCKQYCER